MNNISIIPINTIKPLTPTPIPQEARYSDLATNINLNIGGNISITETEERHEYQKTHDTWGGDIGRATLGGAITGAMAGAGVNGGEYLTNVAGNTLQSTLGITLTNAVNKGISSTIISYTSIIGNTMSMATINGGNLRDVLKSGRDTATSSDTLKNVAVSGLSTGIIAGLTDKLNLTNPNTFTDKLKESAVSNITSTAVQSAINGDSFTESLKHQAINTIVMAGADYAAN